MPILLILLVTFLVSWPAPAGAGEPLTLEEAVRLAVRESARGRIIRGDVEVKQGLYQASRSNFYFPSVSINGQVPAYAVDQSYKFFGGSTRKRLYKTQGLELNSFVQLEQSLLTGGTFNVRANLANNQDRYPDTDPVLKTPRPTQNDLIMLKSTLASIA